jgi:hypothetical protein
MGVSVRSVLGAIVTGPRGLSIKLPTRPTGRNSMANCEA